MKGPGSRSRFDPELRFSFSLIETLSITGQIFPSVLKMTATVYETDNCVCEVALDPCPEHLAGSTNNRKCVSNFLSI